MCWPALFIHQEWFRLPKLQYYGHKIHRLVTTFFLTSVKIFLEIESTGSLLSVNDSYNPLFSDRWHHDKRFNENIAIIVVVVYDDDDDDDHYHHRPLSFSFLRERSFPLNVRFLQTVIKPVNSLFFWYFEAANISRFILTYISIYLQPLSSAASSAT